MEAGTRTILRMAVNMISSLTRAKILIMAGMVSLTAAATAPADNIGLKITEVSGIVRLGDRLLMVSDDEAGAYFEMKIADPSSPIIPIDPLKLKRIAMKGCEAVTDLEGITVLGDGRVAVLSEDLHALYAPIKLGDKTWAVAAQFDQTFTEFGNRGIEGVSALPLANGGSILAVVWEGGYPSLSSLPAQIQHSVGHAPLDPLLVICKIPANAVGIMASDTLGYRVLNTPGSRNDNAAANDPQLVPSELPKAQSEPDQSAPPFAQRFRAPDLVWHIWHNESELDTGVIVLMNSENAPLRGSGVKREYKYKLLQRFTLSGEPVGDAIAINDIVKPIFTNVTPAQTRSWSVAMRDHFANVKSLLDEQNWENVNWEGLGWYVRGESLILIYDAVPADPPIAVVIPIPESWKKSSR